METKQSKQQQQNNDSANNQHNFSKNYSAQSGKVEAVDDSFGARVGSQQILDVLRNGEQTDCSVLRSTSVSAPDVTQASPSPPCMTAGICSSTPPVPPPGNVSFSYEISDGRGQTSSATVSLTLAGGDDSRRCRATLRRKSTWSKVLRTPRTRWAASPAPTAIRADLGVGIAAEHRSGDGVHAGRRTIGLQRRFDVVRQGRRRGRTVSDGQQTGIGMMHFSVKPANTLGAVIDPVVKQTTPDTAPPSRFKPYVHGTSVEPARPTAVERRPARPPP